MKSRGLPYQSQSVWCDVGGKKFDEPGVEAIHKPPAARHDFVFRNSVSVSLCQVFCSNVWGVAEENTLVEEAIVFAFVSMVPVVDVKTVRRSRRDE